MNPVAVGLVVAAAVSHAAWNLCAKRVPDGGAVFVWLTGSVTAVLCVPVVLITVLGQPVRPVWVLAALVSGALHMTYFVLLQRGYAVGDLSVVYPLARGSGPLLAVLAAVLLLGERPGLNALLGAGAVVAGILVIGGLRTGGGNASAGALYGVATGVLIAGYTLWDAHAVTALGVPPTVVMMGAAATQSALLSPVGLRRPARVRAMCRTHWPMVLAVGVLSPIAYLLVLYALRLAPVSMVAPTRELSIVFAGVAAWRLFGEPDPARRLAGAALVVAGVAAIAV